MLFTYDLLGRRTAAYYSGGAHSISYVWDNAGRLTSTTAGGRTIRHQYDQAGNRVQTTWPEAIPFYVTTSYDALNRPTVVRELGAASLATYSYDDLSRRTTVALGNGTTTAHTYNAQGLLDTLTHDFAGTGQDVVFRYVYGTRNIIAQDWSNDLYGWSPVPPGTTSYASYTGYTSNGLNQYTVVASASLNHDSNGNLIGDGVWAYGYDLDNRLRTASKSGLSAAFMYDAEGRLRQTTTGGTVTDLLYDDAKLIGEYSGAGSLVRRYVHGPGVDEPLVWYEGTGTANKTWLYRDHLGSIVSQADGSGANTSVYTYGPFGEPDKPTGARFRYTGQQYLGGLNLYYYKARFYSPALGRFLQTDPIGYASDLNLYAYVGNNPLNGRDPSGLWVETGWDLMNVGLGAFSLTTNVRAGNWGWATVDALGLLYDGVATAVPFLPAGAGAFSRSLRAGNSLSTSLSIGGDTIATANAAHRITSVAPTTGNAAVQGTRYHDAIGRELDQT